MIVYVWYIKCIFYAYQRYKFNIFKYILILYPNSWMKILHFDVLTSCPKDELHQLFLGLYGEHIFPAIVHRHTQLCSSQIWLRWIRAVTLLSNEVVARVFKCLADRLQGVESDTSMINITPEYAAHFLEVYVEKTEGAKFTGDRVRFLMLSLPLAVRDLLSR